MPSERSTRQRTGGQGFTRLGRGHRVLVLVVVGTLAFALLELFAVSERRSTEALSTDYRTNGYIGIVECLRCHDEREHFLVSNHRNTWLPESALDDFSGLPQTVQEGSTAHSVEKMDDRWHYIVQLPGRPRQTVPVHSIMGGERFGFSLILRVDEIEGRRLPRSTLVEARYMIESGTGRLKRSPGLFDGEVRNYNSALGRVLHQDFAEKCLGCHAGPIDQAQADAGGPHDEFLDIGVGCERCHGPGAAHREAAERQDSDLKIRHPGKLPNRRLLDEVCGQCHRGFFPIVQPRPADILISNQVTAIESSECFIQSDAGFSCLNCHDPHKNAVKDRAHYNRTCLECHSPEKSETTPCPVNAMEKCIDCHMPADVEQDNFHLTDHWIRVVKSHP